MASPVVGNRIETAITAAGTTLNANIPANTVAGDLLIMILAWNTDPGAVTFTGYTEFGSNSLLKTYYRVADGNEGATDVCSWVNSAKAAHLGYRITGHADPGTQPPEAGTIATGTSTTPDPPSISPTGGSKDYLFLAFFHQAGEEADDDTWCTASPTNYANRLQKTTGTAGAVSANCSLAAADRQATTATENPATFTVAQSLAWRAQTVAIHPAAAQNHSRTPSDVVTLASAAAPALIMPRSAADVGTLADAQTRLVVQTRPQADINVLSDTQSLVKTMIRAPADVEALSDSEAHAMVMPRQVADLAALADLATYTNMRAIALTDVEVLSDAQVVVNGRIRAVADVETLVDSISRALAFARTTADQEGLADSPAVARTVRRAPADVQELSDGLAVVGQWRRSPGDAEGLADSMVYQGSGLISRNVADALTLADSMTYLAVVLHSRSVGDVEALLDAATRVQLIVRAFADVDSLFDAMALASVVRRTFGDLVSLSDLIVVVGGTPAMNGPFTARLRRGGSRGRLLPGGIVGTLHDDSIRGRLVP